ncbi:malate synthase [Holotrichia oblita]|uniref:Malate synthase n=1 Tax=Holotrichia oblita TaxID=644536 RepID=A0ACB9T6F8_HOLOL|nr:malate synthase [Holotrichia oblita]
MIEINVSPPGLETAYQTLFTETALSFLTELFLEFETRINQLYYDRCLRKYELKKSKYLPQFSRTKQRRDRSWLVKPVPGRLADRRLDLGDVSPSDSTHFFDALNAEVQGIQVDFDDGHCPTWRNQITGLYNVYKVVHRKEDKILKSPKDLPILMLRPRAWNMIEHNIMINGKKVPGPLVDFAILMYHNGSRLYEENSGPCFYLSKLESATEAKLWNDIFIWTQNKLGIPQATIKACVLIENILASFEMEEILFELKDHSLGLNCGIWDYAASIIAKFGHRNDFILPDRNKYVNMQRHFLKKYMELVVQICHSRGAHATGGMAAQIVTGENPQKAIENVVAAKTLEIQTGVDGFMVYDIKLVPKINQLWRKMCNTRINQLDRIPTDVISEADLLRMPSGGVTKIGLKHNVEVSILFVYNWLCGNGHFINKNSIEDSATAEISRSQVWQWITHMARLEENSEIITFELIRELTQNYVNSAVNLDKKYVIASANIFLDIVSSSEPPDFITTYLNDHYVFRRIHGSLEISKYNHKL